MPIGFKDSIVPNGPSVRRAREQKGWSQEALVAAGSGEFAIETLRRAERGQRISREKLAKIAEQLDVSADTLASQERFSELLEMFTLEVPQSVFAGYVGRTLGYEKLQGFELLESTGDIDTDKSRLIIAGGIRVKFRLADIEKAQSLLVRDLAAPFTARGMRPTCWVVEGFKERWGKESGKVPRESHIICLLEAGTLNVTAIPSNDLADGLVRYAVDIPDDADRSFLNALPEPSVSKDMLAELLRREEWRRLHAAFWEVGSLRPGIVIQWACDLVRSEAQIKDEAVRALLKKTKPKDGALRTWSERFVNEWFEKQPRLWESDD